MEMKIELDSPVKAIYEILKDHGTLAKWNIVVQESTLIEPKKHFMKTNVGDITNIEIENVPCEKMTSVQEGSIIQKIGYIFEDKGESTIVTLWAEFELEDQRNVMEIAGDLFLKSLKVYANYLKDGGNSSNYKKSFSKIRKA